MKNTDFLMKSSKDETFAANGRGHDRTVRVSRPRRWVRSSLWSRLRETRFSLETPATWVV